MGRTPLHQTPGLIPAIAPVGDQLLLLPVLVSLAPPRSLHGRLPWTRALVPLAPSYRELVADRAQAVEARSQAHVDQRVDEEGEHGGGVEHEHGDVQGKVLVGQVVEVEDVGQDAVRYEGPHDIDEEERVEDEVQREAVDGAMKLGPRGVLLLRRYLGHGGQGMGGDLPLVVTVRGCQWAKLVHGLAGEQQCLKEGRDSDSQVLGHRSGEGDDQQIVVDSRSTQGTALEFRTWA